MILKPFTCLFKAGAIKFSQSDYLTIDVNSWSHQSTSPRVGQRLKKFTTIFLNNYHIKKVISASLQQELSLNYQQEHSGQTDWYTLLPKPSYGALGSQKLEIFDSSSTGRHSLEEVAPGKRRGRSRSTFVTL